MLMINYNELIDSLICLIDKHLKDYDIKIAIKSIIESLDNRYQGLDTQFQLEYKENIDYRVQLYDLKGNICDLNNNIVDIKKDYDSQIIKFKDRITELESFNESRTVDVVSSSKCIEGLRKTNSNYKKKVHELNLKVIELNSVILGLKHKLREVNKNGSK